MSTHEYTHTAHTHMHARCKLKLLRTFSPVGPSFGGLFRTNCTTCRSKLPKQFAQWPAQFFWRTFRIYPVIRSAAGVALPGALLPRRFLLTGAGGGPGGQPKEKEQPGRDHGSNKQDNRANLFWASPALLNKWVSDVFWFRPQHQGL